MNMIELRYFYSITAYIIRNEMSLVKTLIFTTLALLAFAGNSVLCRLALNGELIDATSFTVIRLISGIVMLLSIVTIISFLNKDKVLSADKGSWLSAFFLFAYALSFSYAYINLDTGTGALILFSSVQFTMVLISTISGNKLHSLEAIGFFIAFTGFVYLNLPSINQPPLNAFILMIIAGISWGIYSVLGRYSKNPIADTSQNFIKTLPFLVILGLLMFSNSPYISDINITTEGVIYAVISGAVMSGVGYSIWYMALGGLSVMQAAMAQLLVPIISAIGGVLLLNELITLRLFFATLLIIGGILIALLAQKYRGGINVD